MHPSQILAAALLLSFGCLAATPSEAGPYADDMAKCLVKSSTPADRASFIKFMFVAIARHPDVQGMSKISPQQEVESAKATGQLIQRLMVEACRSETQQAIRFEGTQTVFYAFQVFGQAAAAELFGNPNVADVFKQANKYMDIEKLKSLVADGAGNGGSAAPAAPASEPPAQ
jgi:hypothetical protein